MLRSGARTKKQVLDFSRSVWREVWMSPFNTPRKMIAYAAIQEKATHRNYEQLRSVALEQGATGAAGAIRLISKDEAFHHAFYRDVMKLYLEYDEVSRLATCSTSPPISRCPPSTFSLTPSVASAL